MSMSMQLHCLIDKVFPFEYSIGLSSKIRLLSEKTGAFEGRDAKVEDVPLDKVHPGQSFIRPEHVVVLYECMNEWENTAFPTALKVGDEYYVLDGHHRVMAKILADEKTMKMKITEVSMENVNEINELKDSNIGNAEIDFFEKRKKRAEELHIKIKKYGGLEGYLNAKYKNLID